MKITNGNVLLKHVPTSVWDTTYNGGVHLLEFRMEYDVYEIVGIGPGRKAPNGKFIATSLKVGQWVLVLCGVGQNVEIKEEKFKIVDEYDVMLIL